MSGHARSVSKTLELSLRISLWLLFVVAALHALLIAWAGVTFGFALWDINRPSPTLHWLAAIAFPLLLFKFVPRTSDDPNRTVLVGVCAWTFVVYYVLFYLGEGHILDCGLRWSC